MSEAKPAKSKVVFNEPIDADVATVEPPPRGSTYAHADIQLYIELANAAGFEENAIVTRRTETSFTRRLSENWGIVKKVWRYRSAQTSRYFPYEVMWFHNGAITSEWAESLFVIHPALEYAKLNAVLAAQSEVVSFEPK